MEGHSRLLLYRRQGEHELIFMVICTRLWWVYCDCSHPNNVSLCLSVWPPRVKAVGLYLLCTDASCCCSCFGVAGWKGVSWCRNIFGSSRQAALCAVIWVRLYVTLMCANHRRKQMMSIYMHLYRRATPTQERACANVSSTASHNPPCLYSILN